MSMIPARFTRLLFSVAVAGGLAFGTQSAFADAARGSTCPWDPANGAIARSCTPGAAGNAYCDGECKSEIGSWSFGHCDRFEGCCVCAV